MKKLVRSDSQGPFVAFYQPLSFVSHFPLLEAAVQDLRHLLLPFAVTQSK